MAAVLRRICQRSLPLMLGAMTLAAALASSAALAQSQVQPDQRVVRSVVVRSAPSTGSLPLDALEPGEAVSLTGELPRWYEVILPDGRKGFVSKAWTVLLDGQPGTFKVHVIDVGTGLAIFVEGPDFTLLYDAGSQDDAGRGARNRVVAYLKKVRPGLEAIDHVVLSHAHKDHLSLLPDIFASYAVRHVWDSGREFGTCGYRAFLAKVIAEPGAAYHTGVGANRAQVFSFGECQSPPATLTVQLGSALERGRVALGTTGAMHFLWLDTQLHADPQREQPRAPA